MHHNRCIVTHSIGPEVVRRSVVAGRFPGTRATKHVGEKKGSISMVYLAVLRRSRRLEVVRQSIAADIVAS